MKIHVVVLALSLACAGARNTERSSPAANFKSRDGTPVASAGQPSPGGKMICTHKAPLGSHVPKRICMYEQDVDDVRRETQDALLAHPPVQVRR